jgi:hypothetical protein
MVEKAREELLEARLLSVHRRMQWIADDEARTAWLKGAVSDHHFMSEKERLIEETERILDELGVKQEASR